jgi:hypothetical protein
MQSTIRRAYMMETGEPHPRSSQVRGRIEAVTLKVIRLPSVCALDNNLQENNHSTN